MVLKLFFSLKNLFMRLKEMGLWRQKPLCSTLQSLPTKSLFYPMVKKLLSLQSKELCKLLLSLLSLQHKAWNNILPAFSAHPPHQKPHPSLTRPKKSIKNTLKLTRPPHKSRLGHEWSASLKRGISLILIPWGVSLKVVPIRLASTRTSCFWKHWC